MAFQGYRVFSQQVCQGDHGGFTARRAEIYLGFVRGDGFGIGPAAGMAALPALGLGQQGVYLFHDGIALHPEVDRGIAQQEPKEQGQGGDGEDCNEH